MVVGTGFQGGTTRCYYFWLDFLKCLERQPSKYPLRICQEEREDYIECIQLKKQVGTMGVV